MVTLKYTIVFIRLFLHFSPIFSKGRAVVLEQDNLKETMLYSDLSPAEADTLKAPLLHWAVLHCSAETL